MTAASFVADYRGAMLAIEPGVLLNAAVERGLQHATERSAAVADVAAHVGPAPAKDAGFCFPHTVLVTDAATFLGNADLQEEHFGPVTLFVKCESDGQLHEVIHALPGQLTASVHCAAGEEEALRPLLDALRERVGRLIWNGYPTGVEVSPAMQHGGPWPATSAATTTSVGMNAIKRFLRPLAWQDVPDALLPEALQNSNPLGILRLVDGEYTRAPLN